MGTTVRAACSKSYAFSTNYYACIAIPQWHRCAPPVLFWPWLPHNLLPRSCLTWNFFVDHHCWVPLCMQRLFNKSSSMHCNANMNVDEHLIFCFNIDLHLTCPKVMFNLDFLDRSSLIGTTLRALPIKSCVIITTYHVCIAMPAPCICAPLIYVLPSPPCNRFLVSLIVILSYFPLNALNWPYAPYSPYIVIYGLSVYLDFWLNWVFSGLYLINQSPYSQQLLESQI